MKITILGARGSVPTNGRNTLEFGGSTSCVLVESADQAVYLDAGTGMIHTPDIGDRHISIFITHPHIDHLMGMPFFPYNNHKGRRIDVYGKSRNGMSISEQVACLVSPPLWPCTMSEYKADYDFYELKDQVTLGRLTVTATESEHPGGSLIYRVSEGDRSFVYATDYEYTEETAPRVIEFAKDTDLLMIDGQYTEEEISTRSGFGHSTAGSGIKIMQQSGAKSVRFIHHDPRHTDEDLLKMEEEIRSDSVAFAREGEVIVL